MAKPLANKVALVTGGSRGLGLAMARALGRAGACVAITARKEDELAEAGAMLKADGIDARPYRHDLAQTATSSELAQRIGSEAGPIDLLVNNAGATWGGDAVDLDWRAWRKVMDVNLDGTWALTQAVARAHMIPRRSGNVIVVASVGGLRAVPPNGTPTLAYNASKAAQLNLVRALAAEWGRHNVRVNALAPGWFATRMTEATLSQKANGVLPRIPAGRFGDVETDIAGPVLFLASDASRYVTGHTLVVDGGMSSVI